MGSVSAPLLASVSAALAVLVISNEHAFRHPNAALLLLIAATFALIGAVQFTFRARQFAVTPSEIEQWWPNPDDPPTREFLRRDQRYHELEHTRWSDRARLAYDTGLLCFLLSLVMIVAPRSSLHHAGLGALLVEGLSLIAFLTELGWIIHTRIPRDPPDLPTVGPEWHQRASVSFCRTVRAMIRQRESARRARRLFLAGRTASLIRLGDLRLLLL
jgi:hypothetical protein